MISHAFTNLTLNSTVDIDFGEIEYSGGDTGNISLGTNGVINYTSGFSGAGIGVAGQSTIRVAGRTGAPYVIYCSDAGAQVSDGNGEIIPIEAEFVTSSGARGNYGSGTACSTLSAGVGPFTGTPRTIYLGARLNVSSAISGGGIYSTSNGGGSPIDFVVVLQ
ncbi:MAG: hypothetical protein MK052_07585 [Alphaproteobacteria bacterium]|nr:hypothetical protein [Alphaproteobacteria bacterium]